jgi:GGDEF domain-containing protein
LSRVNQQLQLQLDENRSLAERDALTRIANRYRLEKVLLEECDSRRTLPPAPGTGGHGCR